MNGYQKRAMEAMKMLGYRDQAEVINALLINLHNQALCGDRTSNAPIYASKAIDKIKETIRVNDLMAEFVL